MKFLESIKEEIKPDTSVLVEIEIFVKEINKELKNNKINAICVKGGSVAKGTFIKGDFDIDLFVQFNYSYKDENLSDLLEKILKKFSPERVHGSRDYYQLKQGKLNYEIVPVLNVTDPEKALNVTDMSPLHVNWVKKHLKKDQENEIRLAKKFCKSIGVYGAESYISGFSGHVIDILIINYGSLVNLLNQSQKWKKRQIIDVEKYYKNSQEVLFNLNQSKIQGPLIVIDPIDKKRNASSALNYEKFSLFIKKAKEFLNKPGEKFFEELIVGKTELKKKFKKNLYIINLEAKIGKRDVIGSKILKSFKFLKSELTTLGFTIKDSGWSWNNKKRVLFWFVLKNIILPDEQLIKGPPLDKEKGCIEFKKKYDNVFEQDNQLFSKVNITKKTLEDNLPNIINKDYFKSKIKYISYEKYI
jgi:tRNA nucleotidyltransferase (CCA-adding enzyme)